VQAVLLAGHLAAGIDGERLAVVAAVHRVGLQGGVAVARIPLPEGLAVGEGLGLQGREPSGFPEQAVSEKDGCPDLVDSRRLLG
jgi:hypothetical protein